MAGSPNRVASAATCHRKMLPLPLSPLAMRQSNPLPVCQHRRLTDTEPSTSKPSAKLPSGNLRHWTPSPFTWSAPDFDPAAQAATNATSPINDVLETALGHVALGKRTSLLMEAPQPKPGVGILSASPRHRRLWARALDMRNGHPAEKTRPASRQKGIPRPATGTDRFAPARMPKFGEGSKPAALLQFLLNQRQPRHLWPQGAESRTL